jgi:hypothetical protein
MRLVVLRLVGLLLVSIVLVPGSAARAASVVLGTSNLYNGGMPIAENTQAIAQTFTLTSTVSLSAIDLFIGAGNGLEVDPLTVQISDSLGPGTTPADIVLTTTMLPSAIPSIAPGAVVSLPVSVTLGPGSYALVLSTTDIWGYDWALANTVLPSVVGTVGQSLYCCFPNPVGVFPPAETFKSTTTGPPQYFFQLESAPEPLPVALLALALGALALRRAAR